MYGILRSLEGVGDGRFGTLMKIHHIFLYVLFGSKLGLEID
jgi:hypothetical protein